MAPVLAEAARPEGLGHDARPRKGLAVLTCMDARLDPAGLLDLGLGDAHVLRNAGGIVTADVLEPGAVAGAPRHPEHRGRPPHPLRWAGDADAAPDPEATVRAAVRLLRAAPELPHREAVRGFVLDAETGALTLGPPRAAAGGGSTAATSAGSPPGGARASRLCEAVPGLEIVEPGAPRRPASGFGSSGPRSGPVTVPRRAARGARRWPWQRAPR